MPYISLVNLTRYDGKIKEYAEDNFAPADAANWQKTEKAGAVAFYPVPETVLEPVVDFLFTETGPAEGEKGPDNPSTITGVESVKVTRCGANLLVKKTAAEITRTSLSFTCDGDGSYVVDGTADTSVNTFGSSSSFSWNLRLLPNGTYTLFFKEGSAGVKMTKAVTKNGTTTYSPVSVGTVSSSVVLDSDTTAYSLYFYGNSGDSYTNVIISPCLCLGTTATSFEPYAGTDYTIDLGGTYYGGSVDLSAGTMTATKEYITISSVSGFASIQNGTAIYRFWTGSDYSVVISDGTETCDKLPYARSGSGVDRFFVGTTQNASGQYPIYIILKTSHLDFSGAADPANPTSAEAREAVNTYLASNPLHVVATRKEPATIQLSPVQILSLSQTDPYTPRINTVYSDQQSVQVGYAKSPIYTESELTNAIISLGGNV